jgi:hypothetical protein
MESHIYTLKHPIKYANKGDHVEASFIELKAPTTKNLKECGFLKQAFFQTINSSSKGATITEADIEVAKEQKDENFSGAEIMMLLSGSSEIKFSAVLATAKELFTSGVAQIDGEEKLTKPISDIMSLEDFEDMTGEYLANFILASSLKSMRSL